MGEGEVSRIWDLLLQSVAYVSGLYSCPIKINQALLTQNSIAFNGYLGKNADFEPFLMKF